jgi:hypothetical protein
MHILFLRDSNLLFKKQIKLNTISSVAAYLALPAGTRLIFDINLLVFAIGSLFPECPILGAKVHNPIS